MNRLHYLSVVVITLHNVVLSKVSRQFFIHGFGPSVVSIGYTCANCTENNYGWVLYILSEFYPATLFYFVVFTLGIRITSAPIEVVLMLDGGGIQKHPLLMSLPLFIFCLTLSFCLCHAIC